jgi:hypothetical protein
MRRPDHRGRAPGNPSGGKVRFRRARILALPEVGWANEFAVALGVAHTTMLNWIKRLGAPAERITEGRKKIGWWVVRSALVRWLEQTGRYHKGRGYE